MKKCPYCAEEIKDEAVVCRYCYKTVRGFRLKRTLKIALIMVLIMTMIKNFTAIKSFYAVVSESAVQFGEYFRNLPETLKKAIEAIDKSHSFGKKSDILMEKINGDMVPRTGADHESEG